jgi:hypothetical protein
MIAQLAKKPASRLETPYWPADTSQWHCRVCGWGLADRVVLFVSLSRPAIVTITLSWVVESPDAQFRLHPFPDRFFYI